MRVLIMMLLNTATKQFHPIFYFESPLAGTDTTLIRFKSKGHRTNGFDSREDALESIKNEIVLRLKEVGGYSIYQETEGNLIWDGEDIPADIQFRDENWVLNTPTV